MRDIKFFNEFLGPQKSEPQNIDYSLFYQEINVSSKELSCE